MSKHKYLRDYLSSLPDFVFDFVRVYYNGESINTQLAYCIDIKIFFNYLLSISKNPNIDNIEDFTPSLLNEITLEDFSWYQVYLEKYDLITHDVNGNAIKRTITNSPKGIARKLSTLRSLFRYLYKNDKIQANITEKLDLPNVKHKIKRPLSSRDTINLIDVLYNGEKYLKDRNQALYISRKQRDIAMFITLLGTGIRISELINLNISDIDFEDQNFIVTRKGGNQEVVFMPIQVENELFTYINQRKWILAADNNSKDALFLSNRKTRITVSAVEKQFKQYCILAGIDNPDKMTIHALRRTFACNMLEDGIDIKMVADLLGHANIEVTHRFYAQYTAKAKKSVMRNFTVLKNDLNNKNDM
ncbi:MAG: tyrosine-type recombinase/integrase [Clostridia bacterium]